MFGEEDDKFIKKPKATPTPKPQKEGAPPKPAKPLSEASLKRLDGLMKKANELLEKCNATTKKLQDEEAKPPPLPEKHQNRFDSLVAELGEFDARAAMLKAGAVQTPEFAHVNTKWKELSTEAKDLLGKIDSHIELWM